MMCVRHFSTRKGMYFVKFHFPLHRKELLWKVYSVVESHVFSSWIHFIAFKYPCPYTERLCSGSRRPPR